MENKSHALAAGAFLLVLLSLVIALAVWLTRDTRNLQIYELSSPDAVTGLQPQASVRFKGVNVGKVLAIGLDPLAAGNVLIRIAIDGQAPMTKSSFATLGFQGVTGLAFVQLNDTGESTEALPSGGTPPARIPMRPSLMTKLSAQGENILALLVDVGERVNQLLSPENQKSFIGAVGSLDKAAVGIERLSADTRKVLPRLMQEADVTLTSLQDTSSQVSESAEEARKSALAFRKVTERMYEKGGTLDQLTRGAQTLASVGDTLESSTLPRINRAIDDTARAARQTSRAVNSVNDNPQSLIFGSGATAPGPGEPGFSATPGQP